MFFFQSFFMEDSVLRTVEGYSDHRDNPGDANYLLNPMIPDRTSKETHLVVPPLDSGY